MNIRLSEISVHFARKKVLTDFSITFEEGQIHGVLGENGAGKSTLAKVISGEIQGGQGKIFLDEVEAVLPDAKAAIEKGICHVHQRPILAEGISVKENLLLGVKNPDKKLLEKIADIWLKDIPLSKKLSDTSADQHFFIALSGALLKNPKFLILDEPSSLLDSSQRDFLFKNLKAMAAAGMNILIITHDLKEAIKYCNTISLLKDGIVLKNFKKNQADEEEITRLLFPANENFKTKAIVDRGTIKHTESVGNRLTTKHTESTRDRVNRLAPSAANESLTLTYSNLTAKPVNKPALFDINFTAESGKITLIQGLAESGLFTLEHIITGIDSSRAKGKITLEKSPVATTKNTPDTFKIQSSSKNLKSPGSDCKFPGSATPPPDSAHKSPGSARTTRANDSQILFSTNLKNGRFNTRTLRKKMGISVGIIPTDRTFIGSNPALKIEEMLTSTEKASSSKNKNSIQELINLADITITPKEPASNLSGGMLQRLIFARETHSTPQLLILCEPLQGLDKFASEVLCTKVNALAKKGSMIIILSSSPFPKELCDRIYQLDSGYLTQMGGCE